MRLKEVEKVAYKLCSSDFQLALEKIKTKIFAEKFGQFKNWL
jgi:hypothetical protein